MDTRPDPTSDSEFFEKLGRLLTLNVDEFKAAIGGKIEEPTRGALVRANEVAFGRGQSSRCVLMDTGPYGVPLSFRGELLAEQSGPWERGTLLYRYFDLRVYEATVKAHAGQIVFRTSWPAEGDRHRAFFGATVKDCLEGFRAWVPSRS